MNCNSCNAPLKPGAKFCTRCGAPQPQGKSNDNTAQVTDLPGHMSMVKQKIFWNIQRGEIARSIKEDEFLQYENAVGIIVTEGTTAYIKANGQLIAEIHGGNYDFVAPAELDKILETRIGGLGTPLKKGWRGLVNLVMGKKVKDQLADNVTREDEVKKLKSLDDVVEYLKNGALFSITLKQDRDFQLIFGDAHTDLDGYVNFAPMNIRTKLLDISVGIRAEFRIGNFNAFSQYYLSDTNIVRTNTLADKMTPVVKSVLTECLYDVELKERRLPADILKKIGEQLKLNDFHGIELVGIIEVTAENEDLERLHALSRKLYLSELELDEYHRSNEFINRMNAAVDDQSVYEKQREVDIYRRMEEINKDGLLAKDEFDKIYMLLSREQRIREAQNENEIEAALADIEKTGLLGGEELQILRDQIAERADQRGFAIRLMQLRNAEEYEKTRIGTTQNIELQSLEHELGLQRRRDDYADQRRDKKREQDRQETLDERDDMEFMFGMAERGRQANMEGMERMMNLDSDMEDKESSRRMNEKQQEIDFHLRREQEAHATERERNRLQSQMSEAQIWAQQAQHLDAGAQAEFSRSFSAGKDAQAERELRREQREDMKEMMDKVLGTVTTISAAKTDEAEQRKAEYREQLHREQDRHDRHQDQALNYTTRTQQPQSAQPTGQSGHESTAAKPVGGVKCGKCGGVSDAGENFCPHCGSEITL